MTKFGKILIGLILFVCIAGIAFFFQKATPIAVAPENIPDTSAQNEQVSPKDGILGNRDDLVFFSVLPNTKVHGMVSYTGTIKGGYFFEANILINILDANKKLLKASNAMATADWMTAGPVDFEGSIDVTGLPVGPAYFEIHNDNASGLSENDKSVLIPIVIEKTVSQLNSHEVL